MGKFREQAIKDVAESIGLYPEAVKGGLLDNPDRETPFGACPKMLHVAVEQAETIKELREAMQQARDVIAVVECEEGLTMENILDQIDAALSRFQ